MQTDLLKILRKNSRTNISEYSRKKNIPLKKIHYNYKQIKKNIKKFTPILNLEALGFKRTIIIFKDSTEGLTTISKNTFYINNAIRLDTGLLIEYIYILDEEKEKLLKELEKQKIKHTHYDVNEVIKQEETLT